MSLLTSSQLAAIRGRMSAPELVQRAQRAAALELAGKTYLEARAEVAADIIAAALERTAGTLPRRDDPQVSLTALCNRARTLRRSIDRKRAKDRAQADAEADLAAASADALAPSERTDAEADRLANLPTARETYALARRAARRIGRADAADLIYRSAREAHGLTGAAIASELRDLTDDGPPTVKALDTRCARTRKAIREATDAESFLARLTDRTPRQRWQWRSAPTMLTTAQRTRTTVVQRVAPLGLDFASADMSRPADHVSETTRERKAVDWRVKPTTDAPITTRRTRKRTPKLAQRSATDRTTARANLAAAETIARSPAQTPRPRHGVKAGSK